MSVLPLRQRSWGTGCVEAGGGGVEERSGLLSRGQQGCGCCVWRDHGCECGLGGGGEEVRPIRRKEVRPMKGLGVVSGAGIWV